MLQGLNPGPELFRTNGTLIYSFGWSLMLAGIMTFVLGLLFAPALVRVVMIPLRLLAPLIMFLAVIGAYAIRNSIFDVYLMLALGVFVFLVRKIGFHPGPIGLGLILGPIIEPALVQAMYIANATSVTRVFFSSTVDIILIALTVASVAFVVWQRRRDSARDRAELATEGAS